MSFLNMEQRGTMSASDFTRLSNFIYNNYGIKLPLSKKIMLEGRLQKRLKALNMSSFKDYCDYIFSHEGQREEIVTMIDMVTTNKTDFFREAIHFDFLSNQVLPSFESASSRSFKLWSAGCATGEEPYTIAMVLEEFSEKSGKIDYQILGTDISAQALQQGITAVYAEEKVIPIPINLKKKYLLRSKNQVKKTVRIVPQLRRRIEFERLNFINNDFGSLPMFDVIFCRNVLIYFDRKTQEKVIGKLCSRLMTGGILFLGHSESITTMALPLVQIHPTIFKKI
ncbi:chemotaxis protein CheR [Mucilaginibacter robiniae]|uniref:protein-glutamate O-methyltransferase n=1 Tax=Mucilaginibacter robiniae TaxID=2728022 RepID=A0A7L5DZK1_9SPHI|nr:CheR family methyltransferase [Mucilaginibacter robiniae]QJD96532.1 chemotaxis protein CheR [Mucilaginibacter robiniae]